MLDLSIVILNYKTRNLTLKCLQSIFKTQPKMKFEVLVVDNHSEDDSVQAIKKQFPGVKIIESDVNCGFAGGNNLALKEVSSKYSLLLNSDTEVKPGALDRLFSVAQQEEFDVSSCRIINPDGSFQPNGGELPVFLPLLLWISGLDDLLNKVISVSSYQERDERYYNNTKEVGWVSGTAMLIKNDILKKIGFLDEKIFMYGEDVEFCLKARRAGFKVGWIKEAEIIHLGGGSSDIPKLNQWRGEFKGLLYIYNKYYGILPAIGLRILFYLFIILRIISFAVIGKLNYAKTYAKVAVSI